MVKLDVTVFPAADGGTSVNLQVLRADNATPDEEWMAREIQRHITADVVRDAMVKLQGFRTPQTAPAGALVGEPMTAEEVAAAGLPPLDADDGEG